RLVYGRGGAQAEAGDRRAEGGGAELARGLQRPLVDVLDEVGDGGVGAAADLRQGLLMEGDDGRGGGRGACRQRLQVLGDGRGGGGDLDLDEQRDGGHREQLLEGGHPLALSQQHAVQL